MQGALTQLDPSPSHRPLSGGCLRSIAYPRNGKWSVDQRLGLRFGVSLVISILREWNFVSSSKYYIYRCQYLTWLSMVSWVSSLSTYGGKEVLEQDLLRRSPCITQSGNEPLISPRSGRKCWVANVATLLNNAGYDGTFSELSILD